MNPLLSEQASLWIKDYLAKGWYPLSSFTEDTQLVQKIGGVLPFFSQDDSEWERCDSCNEYLQFLCQVTDPGSLKIYKTLQIWWCSNKTCKTGHYYFKQFEEEELRNPKYIEKPSTVPVYPLHIIKDWKVCTDFFYWESEQLVDMVATENPLFASVDTDDIYEILKGVAEVKVTVPEYSIVHWGGKSYGQHPCNLNPGCLRFVHDLARDYTNVVYIYFEKGICKLDWTRN